MTITLTDEQLFSENSYHSRRAVKKRIIQKCIFEYKCSECGNDGIHNNKPLTLQLDHINGKPEDNRISNLRFLCPNCHTQTETYAGKATTGKRNYVNCPKIKLREEKRKADMELWQKLKMNKELRLGEWGWKTRLAKEIPLSSQKVMPWLRRIDPDFVDQIEA